MTLLSTPICDFGLPAPDFSLPDTNGKIWTRDSSKGPEGLLVVFICNHCPYVKGILERLLVDIKKIQALGFGCVAIMSNDVAHYPDDAPEKMHSLATTRGFSFPYLYDADQSVAKAYDAVCTPDFFGYNGNLELQYRGRLDASHDAHFPPDGKHELVDAMGLIKRTGSGPEKQIPSMGCSIKWQE